MMRFVGKAYFGLIKAKKITKNYNVIAIAQKFGLNALEGESQSDIIERYMQFWEQKDFRVSNFAFFKLYQAEHQNQSLEFTKAQIASRYSEYNQLAKNAINNFYILWVNIGLAVLKNDVGGLDTWKKNIVLLNIVQTVNQFFHLASSTKENSLLLINFALQIRSSFRSFPLLDYSAAYRKAVDGLMLISLKKYSQQQILQIIRNLSVLNVHYWYYQNALKVIKHFLSGIDNDWQISFLSSRVRLINGLEKLGVYNKEILQKSEIILKDKNLKVKYLDKIFALKFLISSGKVTSQNITQYESQINSYLADKERRPVFFNQTVNHFYRAGIWLTSYWVKFFEYMETDANPNIIEGFQIYSIFQLVDLYKEQIDPQIVEKANLAKETILKKYQTLNVQTLKKEYEDKYTTESLSRVNCQSQIANCLRLFRHGNVRTEVFIFLFNVDILIEDRFVVEINGGSHYIYDLDQPSKILFSLKTEYRNKVLEKLGYIVINVNLSNFGEASFDLLERIMEIIKQNKKETKGKVLNIMSV